jgi:hypothetical protein
MGWSLSRLPPSEPGFLNAALLAAGKALYLTNAFESKCRFVLRVAQLDSYLEIHPEATFPDAIASLSKEKLLGPTISKLRRFPNVKAAEIVLLEKARNARNFIAHEGAAFGFLYSVKEQRIRNHLVKLRANVADLARGDDVVSRWVYEIEEKEPASLTIMSDYPVMVDTWVFFEADCN